VGRHVDWVLLAAVY